MDAKAPQPISPIPSPPVIGAVRPKRKPAGDLTPDGMLLLARKIDESIIVTIPGRPLPLVITFERYRRSSQTVLLAVFAEKDIEVDRSEIWQGKQQERIAEAAAQPLREAS